ncbi:unnamed protein product [Adineta steineri]|uniref:Arrestin C-terminal-like domain-containing protein n=1 Tax=Adineta steineri TaxID=433720 RepID=A0A813Z3A2_9BILA|nr:unnamed protein product [Adineta steineri]CAF1442389.1 unnamed protein product [Adineta steineri]CAF1628143.1 unnamed protein product [Adineta steineri]CAF3596637.1 unnamed protein product [Adineta steineri]
MGLNSTKSALTNAEYSLTLSSPNDFYRNLSTIQGEFHLNVRSKLRIEKEIRIDLIGQLLENKKYASRSNRNSSQFNNTPNNNNNIFLTYSCSLITSHENGTARTIKHQQVNYPFRIPLGSNLPPSCEFKEFCVVYYLEIYHDGRLLPNTHKRITIAPQTPQIIVPLPCKVTGSGDVTMICSLPKSFYSGRDCPVVPMSMSITNPKQKQIKAVTAQLMQTVSLNGIKRENEIFTALLNEIAENTKENEVNTKCELVLPANLSPTYVPNETGQPDNVPSIAITYEFRITAQMKGATTPNIRLSVPIGIE